MNQIEWQEKRAALSRTFRRSNVCWSDGDGGEFVQPITDATLPAAGVYSVSIRDAQSNALEWGPMPVTVGAIEAAPQGDGLDAVRELAGAFRLALDDLRGFARQQIEDVRRSVEARSEEERSFHKLQLETALQQGRLMADSALETYRSHYRALGEMQAVAGGDTWSRVFERFAEALAPAIAPALAPVLAGVLQPQQGGGGMDARLAEALRDAIAAEAQTVPDKTGETVDVSA